MSDAPEQSEIEEPPPKTSSRPWLRPLLMVFVPVLILAVILAIVRPIMMEMIQPPPRILASPPRTGGGTGAGTGQAAPAPRANDPALVNAFGAGAIGVVSREIARRATVGADAVGCGLRDHGWLNDFRNAVVADIAQRTHSYDSAPADATQLRRFLTERFSSTQNSRLQGGIPDRDQRCGELATLSDFRAADILVRTHRAAAR